MTKIKTWQPEDPSEVLQGTVIEVREDGIVVENADGRFLVRVKRRTPGRVS